MGAFRISQPGSSVATSLTAGEAVRKHVGVLDIRGQSFCLRSVPLVHVRSFVMGDLSLNSISRDPRRRLDPEDPNVDQAVSDLLEEQVVTKW